MATRIIKEPEDNPSLASPLVPTHDAEAAARNSERIEAEKDNKAATPYRSRGYHAWYDRQQSRKH